MRHGDTIVALSSGALPSGVAVIRISGPGAAALLSGLLPALPPPRRLALTDITVGGDLVDRGLVAWFPAPRSFTGEDCAELQVHGSPAVVRALLRALTAAGGRLAEAGEFTRRAFENGKLDLTEVEGLGDLITAETEAQRHQAMARLSGALSRRLETWRERLATARAELEAQLDFSDEADVGALPAGFLPGLRALAGEFAEAIETVGRGRIVREGLRVALAGPPNAGKSSLLNALARSDVAIVTPEAGTTRDVREVPIDLDGRLVILLDMAGLRETESLAEAEGVRRARHEIARADLVLWLMAPDVPPEAEPAGIAAPLWRVATKVDIGPVPGALDAAISTRTGEGLAPLLAQLRRFAADAVAGAPALLSRERDLAALTAASAALNDAMATLHSPELAAESLRAATQALERLVGRIDAEAVLDRLFSAFCIGK
ncbi:tRNA uridine-5-carboxymethylaminomethyl(34) synthesis GTPase MnmE [Devosia sp.]|uniref:tRNA uridine-5-carboxymethylaminomethyl(34) synthesis GTPase MnmE n=1 Tax=Devosia sp. TaxID=1871048 RepID=UPI002EE5F728